MICLLVARPAVRPVIFTPVARSLGLEHIIVAIKESKIAPCIHEAAVAVLPAELGRPRQQPVLGERPDGKTAQRAALGQFFILAEPNESGFRVWDV